MTHGSLFNGIGGFLLAAQWAGIDNVFSVEIDEFCNKVSKYHFPKVKQYYDIKEFSGKEYAGQIDIISAGFPCQSFSVCGKQGCDLSLWKETIRVIKEIAPDYCICENVYGIISTAGGLGFRTVCSDLEDAGYEVQAFVIPACGVNAPHRRDRVWFVAKSRSVKWGTERNVSEYAARLQRKKTWDKFEGEIGKGTFTNPKGEQRDLSEGRKRQAETDTIRIGKNGITADTEKQRLPKRNGKPAWNGTHTTTERHNGIPTWQNFPTEPPIHNRNDGLSFELHGITFPKWRNESIKVMGNTIVPQVAFRFFKIIKQGNEQGYTF